MLEPHGMLYATLELHSETDNRRMLIILQQENVANITVSSPQMYAPAPRCRNTSKSYPEPQAFLPM